MMHAPCTSKAPHAPHVWGDSGPAWGGGSPDTWECPGIPTEQFGATETYPSKAAGYGAEGLMAMAGTLAERAEQDIPGVVPAQQVPAVQAQVATAYAVASWACTAGTCWAGTTPGMSCSARTAKVPAMAIRPSAPYPAALLG